MGGAHTVKDCEGCRAAARAASRARFGARALTRRRARGPQAEELRRRLAVAEAEAAAERARARAAEEAAAAREREVPALPPASMLFRPLSMLPTE